MASGFTWGRSIAIAFTGMHARKLARADEAVGPRETDQLVSLNGLSWNQYVALNKAVGDRPGLRMTFLDGVLEIMSPSNVHEHRKKLMARLIEAYADESDLPLIALGSTTYRKKPKRAGAEPDECYHLGFEKEYPDLAIEVVHTSGGIDKLEVFKRLGVREVWFFVDPEIQVFRLGPSGYSRRDRSEVLRGIDLGDLSRLVANTPPSDQYKAVRRYRLSLRRGAKK